MQEAIAGTGSSRSRRLVFGEFAVDLQRGSVTRGGEDIPLRPKTFAVLQYLLGRAGQLVAREELLAAVWPGLVVGDDSIAQCLIELRKVLGDDTRTMIRTVPRRGLIFDLPVRLEEAEAPPSQRRGSRAARHALILILALAALVVLLYSSVESPRSSAVTAERAASPPATDSIAVLRFADLSPAGDQSWLADGLSEEIMHRLAQSSSLRVIARVSSFAVEGQPVAAIAEQLDVSHVLEGSVRRQGDAVRVTAQLVDAATSLHIWSRTYSRELDDIFAVQEEIALAVADSLQASLTAMDERTDIDPRAYERFLEGRHFYLRRAEGDLAKAQDRFEEALAISPEFARAWAGLSAVANVRLKDRAPGDRPPADRQSLLELQRHATEQALRFGPDQPEAHIRAAYFYYLNDERKRSLEHVEIARSLDPDHWLVRTIVANDLRISGRIDEALPLIRREIQKDPLNLTLRENMVSFLIWAQRFDEAQAELERVLELAPYAGRSPELSSKVPILQVIFGDFGAAVISIGAMPEGAERSRLLALNQYALGFREESDAALAHLISTVDLPWRAFYASEVHAYRGEGPAALDWLRRIDFGEECKELRLAQFVYYSPFLSKLSGDPAWEEFRSGVLRRMQHCAFGLEIEALD